VRILVEPSDIILRNAGDSAMLIVALRRLRGEFPEARITVLTQDEETLRAYAPDVEPLSARGRNTWAADLLLLNHLRRLPPPLVTAMRGIGHRLRRHAPGFVRALLRVRGRFRGEVAQYLSAVETSDLVVVGGGGGLTDAFAGYALAFLETLELALERGKPVALMGQGVGPIESAQLRRRTRSVLRRADLIALREDLASRPLLRALAIAEENVVTTGDDAIELAYERRPPAFGAGIGVNVRVAGYAGVSLEDAQSIRSVVAAAAQRLGGPIVPIPISRYEIDSDFATLQEMFPDAALPEPSAFDVAKAIDLAGRCRIVVAGSYHAAVFALSIGVPAVCIASSPYYVDKFNGLAAQFGAGCHVELLHAPDFTTRLERAIDAAWAEAETIRPRLLEAAARQIDAGREAYRRLRAIVNTSNKTHHTR
jgi:colanic acid/amylovoran biosynthesis protein